MAHELQDWLTTLDPEELAGILTRRPDVHATRVPRDLHELAGRLAQRTAVAAIVRELPLPAAEIVEALQALLPVTERNALAALLGRAADDPELDAALRVLSQRALAWPSASGTHVYLTPSLHSAFARPLGLGSPAVEALARHTVSELRKIAERLHRPAQGTKGEILADLAGWLAEPGNVTELVAEAPEDTRELLDRAAAGEPLIEIPYTTT